MECREFYSSYSSTVAAAATATATAAGEHLQEKKVRAVVTNVDGYDDVDVEDKRKKTEPATKKIEKNKIFISIYTYIHKYEYCFMILL